MGKLFQDRCLFHGQSCMTRCNRLFLRQYPTKPPCLKSKIHVQPTCTAYQPHSARTTIRTTAACSPHLRIVRQRVRWASGLLSAPPSPGQRGSTPQTPGSPRYGGRLASPASVGASTLPWLWTRRSLRPCWGCVKEDLVLW